MIRGLWGIQVDAIVYFKLVDAVADTYKYNPMTSLLARWENIKKVKHGKHCHEQQKLFFQFDISVDKMLGREALVLIYQLSRFMEEES